MALHLACHGYRVVLADYPAAKEFGEKRIPYIPWVLARTGEIQTILNFLQLDSVVLLGHSLGASTLLGLSGGIAAHANANGIADPRLRALVLLAPATSWYQNPGVLVKVQVPILMITAEHDQYFPPATAQIIQQGLPPDTPFEHHMVPNAGNYSFQSVNPESLNTPDSPEVQDPPGFDRTACQPLLAGLITGFLRRHNFFPLASSAKS